MSHRRAAPGSAQEPPGAPQDPPKSTQERTKRAPRETLAAQGLPRGAHRVRDKCTSVQESFEISVQKVFETAAGQMCRGPVH